MIWQTFCRRHLVNCLQHCPGSYFTDTAFVITHIHARQKRLSQTDRILRFHAILFDMNTMDQWHTA